jgi:hypothetical protein
VRQRSEKGHQRVAVATAPPLQGEPAVRRTGRDAGLSARRADGRRADRGPPTHWASISFVPATSPIRSCGTQHDQLSVGQPLLRLEWNVIASAGLVALDLLLRLDRFPCFRIDKLAVHAMPGLAV